ncbi:MAG: hypothetical protein HEEMFOPI_01205 [Holosporales bacterium]
MRKMFKKIFLGFLLLWVSLLVFPIGYYVLDKKRDISEFQDDEHKKYEGVGVYVINLDRSKERLEYIMPNLLKLGLPVHRISAVDGKKLSQKDLDEKVDFFAYKTYHRPETVGPGVVACSMSHIKAWETFLKSDFEFAIVFEDDATFDPKLLRETVDNLIEDRFIWDVCSFDVLFEKPYVKIKKLPSERFVVHYLAQTAGASSYLLSRKAALALIEKSYPIKMTPDDYYTRSWEFGLKFIGVEPRIVKQMDGISDVVSINNVDRKKRIPEPVLTTIKRRIYYFQKRVACTLYNLKNYFSLKML